MANIHHLIAEDTVGSKVLKIAGELGVDRKHDVFVVGGYVRDLFLGRPLKEIDFMVMCDGVEFAEELAKKIKGKKNCSISNVFYGKNTL